MKIGTQKIRRIATVGAVLGFLFVGGLFLFDAVFPYRLIRAESKDLEFPSDWTPAGQQHDKGAGAPFWGERAQIHLFSATSDPPSRACVELRESLSASGVLKVEEQPPHPNQESQVCAFAGTSGWGRVRVSGHVDDLVKGREVPWLQQQDVPPDSRSFVTVWLTSNDL